MDSTTVREILLNLRDPTDITKRVHFSNRAVLFLIKLFTDTNIEIIDLHVLIMKLAHSVGSLFNPERYISCTDVAFYFTNHPHPLASVGTLKRIAAFFTEDKDNRYHEIRDLHRMLAIV